MSAVMCLCLMVVTTSSFGLAELVADEVFHALASGRPSSSAISRWEKPCSCMNSARRARSVLSSAIASRTVSLATMVSSMPLMMSNRSSGSSAIGVVAWSMRSSSARRALR